MACRAPFSRQRERGSKPDRWTLIRAAEFAAAEYGWAPGYIESGLTDEQLVAYLDASSERRAAAADGEFTTTVEAFRAGTIFGSDQRQYTRWRRDADRRSGRQSPGTTIEQLARDFPDHVALPN